MFIQCNYYYSFEAAVTTFNDARPPGIYKPEYLQVLAQRLNGGSMADITVPPRPSWCDDEGLSAGFSDDDSGTKKRMNKQNDVKTKKKEFKFDGRMFLITCTACKIR